MSVQLRFQQVFWDRPTVDAHHLLVLAGAVEVDRFCDELLAGSGFSLNQHGAVQAGNRIDQLENSIHCAATADNVAEPVLFIQLLLQVLVFEAKLAFLEAFAHHDRQLDQLERFGQIVVGAFLDRGHGCFDRAVASDDDPDHLRVPHQRLFQQFDPCFSWQVVVGDQDVVGSL